MKIGVFDSGFGGLDIFGSLIKSLPEHDFIYFGDTACAPYGSRSQESIYKHTTQALDFLFQKDCQVVILACNTASAEALRKIQQNYLIDKYPKRRVLGMIIPAAEAAISGGAQKIGVLATESSVDSEAFVRELQKLNGGTEIFQQACPLLVPLIEEGDTDPETIGPILEKYIAPLVDQNIDTLILGCTHYGILEEEIHAALKRLGSEASVINEAAILAEKLGDYLQRHPEITEKLSRNSRREYFTTDRGGQFDEIGSQVLGEEIVSVRVNLN